MTIVHPAPAPGPPSTAPRGVVVAATVTAFAAVADSTAVTVTLPAASTSLGLTATAASWVVNAYLVALGGLLLLGGRLADLVPRRTLLASGLTLFLAGAAASTAAPDGALLAVARGVQGAGAALALPVALALLTAAAPAGGPRARAPGLWGVASGAGGTVGVLLGGGLLEGPGWRATFLIGAAAALVALVVTLRRVPALPAAGRGRVDVLGAGAVTVGLGALTYALSAGSTGSWTAPGTLAAGAVALGALALFARSCGRHPDPLVAPELVRVPTVRTATLAILAVGAGSVVTFVTLPQYQQTVLGWPGILVGLGAVPMAVAIAVASVVAPHVAARRGTRTVLAAGLLAHGGGLALLAPTPGPGGAAHAVLTVVLPSLLVGVGIGTGFVLATDLGTGAVPARRVGAASGVLSAAREIGGALGVTVAAAAAAVLAEPGSGPASPVGGLTSGHGIALLTAAVVVVAAAVLVLLDRRRDPAA